MDLMLRNIPRKVLIPSLIGLSFVGGFFANKLFEEKKEIVITTPVPTEFANIDKGQPEAVDFSLFWDVWEIVSSRHVDRKGFDLTSLRNGAISGMLSAIGDPFTVHLPPQQSKRFLEDIGGKFSGVGIEIGIRDKMLTVVAPLEDTPAFKAGILAGDKILLIDDTNTEGITLEDAVQLIRGPKGSQVTLTIRRGETEKKISITRDDIRIPAVKLEFIDSDIAHIKLITFNRNVDPQFEDAANQIIKNKVNRIILDLRNNPGGLLDSSINISSWFLNQGATVVIEDFGNGKSNKFNSARNGLLKDRQVVILINQGSASASEIVAGALRDNNKYKLVGVKTFGKGSVQDVTNLRDSSTVKFTIAKWLTPNGHSIDGNGLEPDFEVELTEEDIENKLDPQLNRAIELIRSL